jgi:hypothetical protein
MNKADVSLFDYMCVCCDSLATFPLTDMALFCLTMLPIDRDYTDSMVALGNNTESKKPQYVERNLLRCWMGEEWKYVEMLCV